MNGEQASQDGQVPALTRAHVAENEARLAQALKPALGFSSWGFYFPVEIPEDMIEFAEDDEGVGGPLIRALYVRREKKLLLPLVHRGAFLGVLAARGVSPAPSKDSLKRLVDLGELALDNLRLSLAALTDRPSGALTKAAFFAAAVKEIHLVKECRRPSLDASGEAGPAAWRACLGAVVVKVMDAGRIRKSRGAVFTDALVGAVGAAVKAAAPETAVVGRVYDDVFAVAVPEAGPKVLRTIADMVREAASAVKLDHELTDERIRANIGVGSAVYPRDFGGRMLEHDSVEQAHTLIERAGLAADVAARADRGGVFGFGEILERGGKVLAALPENRVLVDLGRSVRAETGMRFQIRDKSVERGAFRVGRTAPKAEIQLVEVMADAAVGEILDRFDLSRLIEPGDDLVLTGRGATAEIVDNAPDAAAATERLLEWREFSAWWSKHRESIPRCVMAMIRPASDPEGPASPALEKRLLEKKRLLDAIMPPGGVYARSSGSGLVCLHPDMTPDAALELYRNFLAALNGDGAQTVVGLAPHPFLDASRADLVDNCRKALDYAQLMPEPRLGMLDSLALTINADRAFAQNDLYAAVEEYKAALLADPCNTLAKTSLGVCLARLAKPAKAKKLFAEAAKTAPNELSPQYNLGCVCLKLGEIKAAKRAFEQCLKLDPNHVYTLLRLGRIHEERGELDKAVKLYRKAEALPEGRGAAKRFLAGAALRKGKRDEARELLHEALIHDPADAFSLNLLARLHLDNNEDAHVAEVLARQSVALRPDRKTFWLELARAYDAQGKGRQAAESFARAAGA